MCALQVLKHEKFNLAEGYYFLNISYSLLARGAAFCREPDLEARVATLSAGFEAGAHTVYSVLVSSYVHAFKMHSAARALGAGGAGWRRGWRTT